MNAYETLGVSPTASDDEIKKAYRRLALECHPDRNPTTAAETKFKNVGEAYSVLSNPQKKQEHDARLHMGNAGSSRHINHGDPMWEQFFNGGFGGQEWNEMFGQRSGQHSRDWPPQQRDFRRTANTSATLTLEEAFNGVKRSFMVGSATIDIYIPPGVHDGEMIVARVDQTLEIRLRIRVRKHEIFERRNHDLYTRVDVPVHIVMTGGEIEVPSMDGNILLKIPKSVNSHTKLRVRGGGMVKDQAAGNAYYEIRIVVPELTGVQSNLIYGIISSDQSDS
ncbi:MAG TPA: hypothetical protein EYQ00_08300 [Dehalococcoidia bacterium]|nr:hypothetical protein [Dehalococcoidia bacterium]